MMSLFPYVLCGLGTLAVLFGLWGTKSEQGRRMFDEMAGMIPWGVGLLGALLITAGVVWLLIRFFSK